MAVAGGHIYAAIFYRIPEVRKPKAKIWDKWACEFCGTSETPERRNGPSGRITLCNACGLKYKKQQMMARQRKEDEIRRVRTRMSVGAILNA